MVPAARDSINFFLGTDQWKSKFRPKNWGEATGFQCAIAGLLPGDFFANALSGNAARS
jgi:hypothetical protein